MLTLGSDCALHPNPALKSTGKRTEERKKQILCRVETKEEGRKSGFVMELASVWFIPYSIGVMLPLGSNCALHADHSGQRAKQLKREERNRICKKKREKEGKK
ncbi:hypothetical protein BaRGS_00021121 [Batillaria attramentaria]|uniref:Uncharacterized protein n=1 Tax=Batillaria attramentaria TaxID=370345 RepID=A0ABD0KK27_9CAEN